MSPDLLQYIRQLSIRDKKSLTGKALKNCEEVGEIAKWVLPYEGAFATTHRFAVRERILEETVDSILCSLSIAYDLNFSDEEIASMMATKADKWAMLQQRELDHQYPLPYEIHITISLCDDEADRSIEVDRFREACAAIGCRPIVLDLTTKAGSNIKDVMTSSKHMGDNSTVLEEAHRIVQRLKDQAFDVIRVKIETVPWHPAAPTVGQLMPPNCYFESHIPVTLSRNHVDDLRTLIASWDNPYVHLSRNLFKEHGDTVVIMLTVRRTDVVNVEFTEYVDGIVNTLVQGGWSIGKVHVEFSIYDTNITHDKEWTS